MENRKKPANPVPNESPAKANSDDFEPDLKSSGPQPVDGPATPPPSSFGCGSPRPDAPGR